MKNKDDKTQKTLNDTESSTQKEVIRTKHSLLWTHIFMFLQLLEKYPEARDDEEFMNIYRKLSKYVSNKSPLSSTGDILDWYVVVEQEPAE